MGVTAVVVAGVVAALVGYAFLGQSLAILGIPDPGVLTSVGLPFVRGAGTLLACFAVGSFLMSAFGAMHGRDGRLGLDAYLAARAGGWALLGWSLVAFILIPLSLSDVSGQPLVEALRPERWGIAISQVSAAKAWLAVGIIAGIAGLLSFLTQKWIWQPVFFGLSILSLVPIALEGHSAAGGNHDFGVNSLLWHIVCSALWIGGLMALCAHAWRRGTFLATIVQRYSYVALFSIIAIALSGAINAALRVSLTDLVTTGYGGVILAKIVATLVLAWFGWRQRRRIIPGLLAQQNADGTMRSEGENARFSSLFARFAAWEIVIMAATVGLAVSLSRIPPPLIINIDITEQEVLLGFVLTQPPSLLAYLTHWRFDLIFGVGALLLQWGYMAAWRVVTRGGGSWPVSRVVWWTLGNITLIIATCSGLGMYAMALFSPHMLQHVILSMVVPVFWVLGGPMTLLLRALPPAGKNGLPGPREWLVVFINNPLSRFLTNPIVAAVQFVIGFYYLYLSPAFDWLAPQHAGHLFMMIHFIISGYIFYWVIVGVDAAPRNLSPFIKMLTLFGMVTFHAWFGIAMMQMAEPLNADFYRQLNLPFEVDLERDQNLGGGITWALGEIPLLVVSIAHGLQWWRSDQREARRYDRQAERTNDADLQAYNAMLAGMAQGTTDFGDREYYTAEYTPNQVQGAIHSEEHKHKMKRQQR